MTSKYRNISLLVRIVSRYSLVWLADAVSIGITALVLPGIYFLKESQFWYLNPFIVALWLALLNVLIRPFLIILLLPINFLSLGLITLILNSGLFYLMDMLVPSFVIESFPAALIGLLVLSTVNTILANVMVLEEDYSLFANVMDKLSALTKPKTADSREKGLVVLQIDGLSFATLKRAINRGKMPFVGDMLSRRRYEARKWFSGLPSQTSSVQAGIFYGNNFNIPGFRWYDRKKRKQYVSSNSADMYEIDKKFENSDTLLKGGTCINTLIHGGAKKKLITLSVILEKDFRLRKGELEDFAIFSLHPYLYNRAIILMIWDFLIDRFQSTLDIIKRKKPRVKRNIKFSFLRSVGNAFLRESTSYFLKEDIVRGIPIIYANYIGYDVIAHHAGPHSLDAISALSGIDRQIKVISRTITKKAGRSYDIIVLSDHGQTKSIPFEYLYGKNLSSFIEERLKTPLLKSTGYNAERGYFATLLNEMQMVEEAFGTQPIIRSRRTLEKIRTRVWEESEEDMLKEGVVVCCSGNLAHVYFTEFRKKLAIEQLLKLHPTLLEALTTHPGIGFIVTQNEKGEILLIGEEGIMRLPSGVVEGKDPIASYNGNANIYMALKKLGEFPDSGDVILISTFLENGVVISFENQLGTHGGLGGEQTEPFVIYQRKEEMKTDTISNPEEMHYFLKEMLGSQALPK